MKKKILKAHEIITTYQLKGIDNKFMGKYIVVAQTTPKAVSLIPLRDGEVVLLAKEMNHQVFVEGRK